MSIGADKVCLFVPDGLRNFKQRLFKQVADRCAQSIAGDIDVLATLPPEIIPAVGCSVELRELIDHWIETGRKWIYWDRGYLRRVHWTAGIAPEYELKYSYYRWHIGTFQMQTIREVPDDRWGRLRVKLRPWRVDGRHIVVAAPPPNYAAFHRLPDDWVQQACEAIRRITDRPIYVRHKHAPSSLASDLQNAHCLVTHGSIAAVEAVVLGYPVVVAPLSAAALVGRTNIDDIEHPVFPDRLPWLQSIAYCQFNELELSDGTLWRLIGD